MERAESMIEWANKAARFTVKKIKKINRHVFELRLSPFLVPRSAMILRIRILFFRNFKKECHVSPKRSRAVGPSFHDEFTLSQKNRPPSPLPHRAQIAPKKAADGWKQCSLAITKLPRIWMTLLGRPMTGYGKWKLTSPSAVETFDLAFKLALCDSIRICFSLLMKMLSLPLHTLFTTCCK